MIRNDTMRREIEAQPRVLAELLPTLRSNLLRPERQPGRVLAGGCGDSFFAAYALSGTFDELAIPYVPVTAQELVSYAHIARDDLVILISISGETARTVEAAHVTAAAGADTLAITCNPVSSLARASRSTLVLPYQPISRKTPHTLDYTVTLLALALTAERVAGQKIDALAQLPELMGTAIANLVNPAEAAARGVTERTKFFFLGAGPHRGTAMYGAAKFYEAGGLIALHEETENFVHGMNFMLEPGDIVSLIAPSDPALYRVQELVNGLNELGAVVVSHSDADIGTQHVLRLPQMPRNLFPFLACLGPQLLCHAVAQALGLNLEQERAGRAHGVLHAAVQKQWMENTRGPA